MDNRNKIVNIITQFKSVYRRHLHPDIKKMINFPELGLNRRALQMISNDELLHRSQKLLEKIDSVQHDRDREHKGLKNFSQELRYLISQDQRLMPSSDGYNHLIQLSQKLSQQAYIDSEIQDIISLAKQLLKSNQPELKEQAQDIINISSKRSDLIGQAVHKNFHSLLKQITDKN